ncbi:hypothetical protein D3C84_1313120 [compost metagenome]
MTVNLDRQSKDVFHPSLSLGVEDRELLIARVDDINLASLWEVGDVVRGQGVQLDGLYYRA